MKEFLKLDVEGERSEHSSDDDEASHDDSSDGEMQQCAITDDADDNEPLLGREESIERVRGLIEIATDKVKNAKHLNRVQKYVMELALSKMMAKLAAMDADDAEHTEDLNLNTMLRDIFKQ